MTKELIREIKDEINIVAENRIEYYGMGLKEIDPFMIAEDVTEEVVDYFKDDLQDEDEIFDMTYYIVEDLWNKTVELHKEWVA